MCLGFLTREGFTVESCPVDEYGVIVLDELKKLVDDDTVLVSIMVANGEIGTIQPIKEAVEIAHRKNALFHTDATAAMGQIKLDVKEHHIIERIVDIIIKHMGIISAEQRSYTLVLEGTELPTNITVQDAVHKIG